MSMSTPTNYRDQFSTLVSPTSTSTSTSCTSISCATLDAVQTQIDALDAGVIWNDVQHATKSAIASGATKADCILFSFTCDEICMQSDSVSQCALRTELSTDVVARVVAKLQALALYDFSDTVAVSVEYPPAPFAYRVTLTWSCSITPSA
jgi:hypothetical protein